MAFGNLMTILHINFIYEYVCVEVCVNWYRDQIIASQIFAVSRKKIFIKKVINKNWIRCFLIIIAVIVLLLNIVKVISPSFLLNICIYKSILSSGLHLISSSLKINKSDPLILLFHYIERDFFLFCFVFLFYKTLSSL